MEKFKQLVLRSGQLKTVVILTAVSVIFSAFISYIVSLLYPSINATLSITMAILTPLIIAPLVSIPFTKLLFQLHALEIKMRELATFDELTNLHNRRAFLEKAEFAYHVVKRENQNFCMLMVDLDLFKLVNDQYGHATGDAVLALFGQLTKEVSRVSDVAGRTGGEEFCFFLPNTSLEEGEIFANRLHTAVRQASVDYKGLTIHFTVSIGLAAFTGKNLSSLDSLLQLADQAMYEAKRLGRNQTVKVIGQ